MLKLLFGSCMMMLSAVALAAPPTTPVVSSPTPNAKTPVQMAEGKEQPAADKKICRNLDAGFSHRTERVCMTAKQWEEYDRGGS